MKNERRIEQLLAESLIAQDKMVGELKDIKHNQQRHEKLLIKMLEVFSR
jgi:hypothetical protein